VPGILVVAKVRKIPPSIFAQVRVPLATPCHLSAHRDRPAAERLSATAVQLSNCQRTISHEGHEEHDGNCFDGSLRVVRGLCGSSLFTYGFASLPEQ
jgi:hypothetical protein